MLSLTFLISNCGNEVVFPPQKTLIKLSGASVIQLQYPLGNEDKITTDFYSYKTTYQTQDNKIQLNFDILYYKPYGIINVKVEIKNLTNENLNIIFKKFYEGLNTSLIDENNQICYISNNNYLTAIIPVYPNAQISSSSKTCLLTYNLNLGPYLISEIYYGYIVGNDFNELLNSKAICAGCRSVLASYEKKQVFYEIKGGTIVLRGDGIFRIYKVDGSIVYIGKAKSLKLKSGIYLINYNNFTKKEVIR